MNWPRHVGMILTHNDHKLIYQPLAQYIESESFAATEWVSDDEKAKALATDSLWVFHWYPDTPVGFHRLAASTLEAVLAAAGDEDDDA